MKLDKNGNPTIETEFKAQVTTGMMCVHPAWVLKDLLDNDESLKKARHMKEEEFRKTFKRAATIALDASTKVRGDNILRAALQTPPIRKQKPKAKRAKRSRAGVSSK
jgi:hypothetical protein